jgi:drug/metabolite transporter (DMT)-like permease
MLLSLLSKQLSHMEKSLKVKSLLLLFLCALCWGPSYLFIKIAIPTIPPLTLVFLRVGIGAAILYFLCYLQKNTAFQWRHRWKQYTILSITLNALPFCLVSYGELYISSSLTGILNSLTLIFTSLLAHFFGSHDPLTKNKMAGILLGVAGLAVIYLPLLFQEGVQSGMGALMVVIACLSYGIGTVYARTHLQKTSGMIVLTAQLSMATLILFPFALLIDQPYTLPLPSYQAIIGAIGLGVIGTAAGFFLYYKAIQVAGATYASFSVLFIPIIAMILGALILHEQLSWNLYLGTLFILAGVLAINPIFNKKL